MKTIYEILDEYKSATSYSDRLYVLRKYKDDKAFKDVLQGIFDPRIHFIFETEQIPKYKVVEVPPGFGYSTIAMELRRIYIFMINNPKVDPNLTLQRKKEILLQILEALEPKEAEVLTNMLQKKPIVDHLDYAIVKEAFPDLLPQI